MLNLMNLILISENKKFPLNSSVKVNKTRSDLTFHNSFEELFQRFVFSSALTPSMSVIKENKDSSWLVLRNFCNLRLECEQPLELNREDVPSNKVWSLQVHVEKDKNKEDFYYSKRLTVGREIEKFDIKLERIDVKDKVKLRSSGVKKQSKGKFSFSLVTPVIEKKVESLEQVLNVKDINEMKFEETKRKIRQKKTEHVVLREENKEIRGENKKSVSSETSRTPGNKEMAIDNFERKESNDFQLKTKLLGGGDRSEKKQSSVEVNFQPDNISGIDLSLSVRSFKTNVQEREQKSHKGEFHKAFVNFPKRKGDATLAYGHRFNLSSKSLEVNSKDLFFDVKLPKDKELGAQENIDLIVNNSSYGDNTSGAIKLDKDNRGGKLPQRSLFQYGNDATSLTTDVKDFNDEGSFWGVNFGANGRVELRVNEHLSVTPNRKFFRSFNGKKTSIQLQQNQQGEKGFRGEKNFLDTPSFNGGSLDDYLISHAVIQHKGSRVTKKTAEVATDFHNNEVKVLQLSTNSISRSEISSSLSSANEELKDSNISYSQGGEKQLERFVDGENSFRLLIKDENLSLRLIATKRGVLNLSLAVSHVLSIEESFISEVKSLIRSSGFTPGRIYLKIKGERETSRKETVELKV